METKYVYTLEKQGQIIYVSDWTQLKIREEAINRMNETAAYILSLGKSNILEIVDVTGSFAGSDLMYHVRKIADSTKHVSKKKAVVGLSGPRKLLLTTINHFLSTENYAFNTIDEAVEWLLK